MCTLITNVQTGVVQRTPKRGKNEEVHYRPKVSCEYTRTAKWNLFVLDIVFISVQWKRLSCTKKEFFVAKICARRTLWLITSFLLLYFKHNLPRPIKTGLLLCPLYMYNNLWVTSNMKRFSFSLHDSLEHQSSNSLSAQNGAHALCMYGVAAVLLYRKKNWMRNLLFMLVNQHDRDKVTCIHNVAETTNKKTTGKCSLHVAVCFESVWFVFHFWALSYMLQETFNHHHHHSAAEQSTTSFLQRWWSWAITNSWFPTAYNNAWLIPTVIMLPPGTPLGIFLLDVLFLTPRRTKRENFPPPGLTKNKLPRFARRWKHLFRCLNKN